jgi:hypothetical protein
MARKILIIEDEKDIRELPEYYLFLPFSRKSPSDFLLLSLQSPENLFGLSL